MTCEIREICGDWALSINFLYETVTIYFNSLQNAKNVKHIIETDKSVPNCATVCDMVEVVRCKDCRYWQDNNGMGMEALKKQMPKKPTFEGDGYDDSGNIIYDTWICPCCEDRYEVDYERHNYCPTCGQAIDWSDEK